ncbi:hypothetical protein LOK49_LG15G02642 [Camellia lanceoleosa]|uniref:Uncharacterized protein n=1 Tax=Camellia lanceoleosa TaxID=1840588 RepID=A0ACC0F3T7_9ERIC|nr:hypothetical protein LOK49_LG15G02642 [Camellia lanceoleosa]
MAPEKKMHRSAPPKRALIEPIEAVAPSPSKTNAPSPSIGSETVASSLAQTNASAGTETIAPSPSETNAPSPQSRTSGVGASSSRRVWRPTVGKAIEKRIAKNNGNKLYIPITNILCIRRCASNPRI